MKVSVGQTTDDNAVLLNGTQGEIKLEQYPNTKKWNNKIWSGG